MPTLDTRLADAVRLHQAGALEDAEPLYREVLAEDPVQPDALKLLGVVCSQSGRHDEAVALLAEAARARPDDPASHYNLGSALRERGDLDAAAAAFEATLRLDPGHPSALFNLGATRLDLGDAEPAEDAFRRAVAADPGHHRARHQLALLRLERGAVDEAVAQWSAVVEAAPGDVEARLHLGLAEHRAGRIAEAEACFRRVVELAPAHAAGWSNLGAVLRATGRADEAVTALRRAIEIDPDVSAAHTNLALARLDGGDATGALAACHAALRADPSCVHAHRLAARILVLVGEGEEAEAHLEHAAALAPETAALAVERADVLRGLGRLAESEQACLRALALDPQSVGARVARITLRTVEGDRAGALRLADAALPAFPDNPAVVTAAAPVLVAGGRAEEAERRLVAALERPGLADAWRRALLFGLVEAHERLGTHDAAWSAAVEANRLKAATFDRAACVDRIDAIVRSFPAARGTTEPTGAPASPAPVFVAGIPRSGTTLVEQILGAHPDVAAGGELGLLERVDNRIPTLTGVDLPFPACAPRLGPSGRTALAAFASEVLARTAGERAAVTEKSVSNGFYLGLIEMLFPTARVVVCRRDPLDTCVSCYFRDFAGALPWAYDLGDLGFFHRQHDRLLDHWGAVLGLPVLTVRYEELVADQERVTRRLLEFCGLPWNEACLAFHESDRAVLTSSAEQVRTPLYRTAVGRHAPYARHLGPLRAALAAHPVPG